MIKSKMSKIIIFSIVAIVAIIQPNLYSLGYAQQTIRGDNNTAIKGGVCFQGTDLCFEYYPEYSLQDYEKITQYCIDNANKIIDGENPVQELVNANLAPVWFDNKSCDEVNKEVKELQAANEYYANPDLYESHENQDAGQEWWRPPE